jgi:HTH DNA binding domain
MKRITLEIKGPIKPFLELVGFGQVLEHIELMRLEKIFRFEVNALWAIETFKFKDIHFHPQDLLDVEGIGIKEIEVLAFDKENYICLVKTEKKNKFHEIFTDFNIILPPDRPLILTQDAMKISFISYEGQLRTVLDQLSQFIPKEHLKVSSIQDIKHEFTSYKTLLTARQLEIVEYAVAMGYFDLPRKVPAERLAAHLGISVSAFNEHIRKVERTILNLLFRS